jgi:hypothetical protein
VNAIIVVYMTGTRMVFIADVALLVHRKLRQFLYFGENLSQLLLRPA